MNLVIGGRTEAETTFDVFNSKSRLACTPKEPIYVTPAVAVRTNSSVCTFLRARGHRP